MRNTTCDKGDIAVAKTIADLTSRSIKIAVPLSAHLPFDIIAFNTIYKPSRIQVKYCDGNDTIALSTRTISVSSIDVVKHVNFDYIDAYAAYSPITDLVYYVNKSELQTKKNCLTLRIKKISRKDSRIRYADSFLNIDVLWLNG